MHRMETVGQLALGMAHDLNNLLSVVLSSCEPLDRAFSPRDPRFQCVEDIRLAAGQGAALTQYVLAFARGQPVAPRPLDLVALVRTTAAMLARLVGPSVIVRLDLPPEARPVIGHPGQVQQILLDLGVNARDAMPAGGSLTVELRDVPGTAAILRSRTGALERPHVLLALTDTGTGIHPRVRHRMFEPFVTTKPPGQGTGLGLAIVQEIVAEVGGFVEVSTRPGLGTRFEIYLPAAAGELDEGGTR